MSNRQSVLIALQKHGRSTYDELEQSTGISRDKLRIAINDAKKAGHVDAGKDTITGLPAYEISRHGVAWLAKNGVDKDEPEAAEMPTDKECCNAAKVVATTAGSEVAKLREQLNAAEAANIRWLALARDFYCNGTDELRGLISSLNKAERAWEEAMMRAVGEDGVGSVCSAIESIKNRNAELQMTIDALTEQLNGMPVDASLPAESIDVKEAAIGYLIRVPGKRSLIRSKPEGAHAAAMSSARAHGRADVLALVPIGRAIRGAEWRPQ